MVKKSKQSARKKEQSKNKKTLLRESGKKQPISGSSQHFEIDPKRKRLFYAILFLLPVLIIVFLEITLRVFQYGGNGALFVPVPDELANYKMCNWDVGRRYFFMQSTVPNPSKDMFLKEKPENGYRIFVLGGSTAAGYPYGDNVMFSRILYYRLSDVFQDKHIEVVNTAMSAINSYTLLDFMDEILANKPDAILIYAGHNEFYGALGVASTESLGKIRWVIKTYLKLIRFKVFLLIRGLIGKVRIGIGKIFSQGSLADPSATLMERIAGGQSIPFKSAVYEAGKRQFENNLNEIAQKAQNRGVPVFFSELVSNVRDLKPFVSIKQEAFSSADEAFLLAKKFEAQGEYEPARLAYHKARDMDALRFRAPQEFNEIIHRVAKKYEIHVVPIESCFEAASPDGLVGDNLIVDHLHPNIDGYFLMAEAFLQGMRKKHLFSDEWDSTRIKPSSYYHNNWVLTGLDSAYADLNIRYLKNGWPFKPKSQHNQALENYRPATKAESMALKILQDETVSLESAHLELAKYYVKQKQYEKAFREYSALIYIIPFDISLYQPAAMLLFKLNRFERALPLLYQSLKVKETAFADKWIGQILLRDGDHKQALPYLEKSYKIKSDDPQLLWYLSRAYLSNGQSGKSDEILIKLKKIIPDSSGLR